jgi:hypothetical protein
MSQFIYVFELYLIFLCQCLHMSSSESDDSSNDGENFLKTDWNWCKTSTELCRLVYGQGTTEVYVYTIDKNGMTDSRGGHFFTENRTEPNRNRTEMSVFRLFGSASVFYFAYFGVRLRFLTTTEPNHRLKPNKIKAVQTTETSDPHLKACTTHRQQVVCRILKCICVYHCVAKFRSFELHMYRSSFDNWISTRFCR